MASVLLCLRNFGRRLERYLVPLVSRLSGGKGWGDPGGSGRNARAGCQGTPQTPLGSGSPLAELLGHHGSGVFLRLHLLFFSILVPHVPGESTRIRRERSAALVSAFFRGCLRQLDRRNGEQCAGEKNRPQVGPLLHRCRWPGNGGDLRAGGDVYRAAPRHHDPALLDLRGNHVSAADYVRGLSGYRRRVCRRDGGRHEHCFADWLSYLVGAVWISGGPLRQLRLALYSDGGAARDRRLAL